METLQNTLLEKHFPDSPALQIKGTIWDQIRTFDGKPFQAPSGPELLARMGRAPKFKANKLDNQIKTLRITNESKHWRDI